MSSTLEYGAILTGVGGGLALFLYGMRKMTEALKTVAGDGMKTLLGKLTTNRFTGAIAGALVTAVIQSSSVTTVLLVGFITAGLMTFPQSIGVIIGANIGTTITAQIIAFKVTKYALLLIGVGFLMEIASKNQKTRHYGIMFMGLGLIFFGMDLMSDATSPLRDYQPFINLMLEMKNPLVGILIGMLFTAMVQSSSATTGIVIVLAGQGFITLEAGIALILGANVGTCVTAGLSAFGKPREAMQAAVVHIVFNVLGVLIWAAFIPYLADLVRSISPATENLEGAAKLAADSPRQIANAHTIFNIGNALVFIWFTTSLAKLVRRIVPDSKAADSNANKPQYLDSLYLEQPAMALDQVRRELGRLGRMSRTMTEDIFHAATQGTEDQLSTIESMEGEIDLLHGEIVNYLGQLSLRDLVEGQPKLLYEYIAAANYIEHVSDAIETNLVSAGKERLRRNLVVSESTRKLLKTLHEEALRAVDNALRALAEQDSSLAKSVVKSKREFNIHADNARVHLAKRLAASEKDRLENFRIETDMIDGLKRVHTQARRLANTVIEANAEPKKSISDNP